MIERTTELRVRQEISDRVDRASRRRLEARTRAERRARRVTFDAL